LISALGTLGVSHALNLIFLNVDWPVIIILVWSSKALIIINAGIHACVCIGEAMAALLDNVAVWWTLLLRNVAER